MFKHLRFHRTPLKTTYFHKTILLRIISKMNGVFNLHKLRNVGLFTQKFPFRSVALVFVSPAVTHMDLSPSLLTESQPRSSDIKCGFSHP